MLDTPVLSDGDKVPNPFRHRQDNPADWPVSIVQDIVGSSNVPAMRSIPVASIPQTTPDDAKEASEMISLLVEDYYGGKAYIKMTKLPMILSCILKWLRASKKLRYEIKGFAFGDIVNLPGGSLFVETRFGPDIGSVPVFRFTNAPTRLRHRQKEHFKDGDVSPIIGSYPDQDDNVFDPMDLATLLAVAQRQKKYIDMPAYTTYVMYPSHTYDQLILLTATIPRESLNAIEEGDPFMAKITLEQGRVPIDLDKPLGESVLVRMLSAFVDMGVQLSAKMPFKYEEDEDSESESDSESDSEPDE